ncbi:MAG: hypothetical protein Q9227_003811 [Pyrenula ochraceoflavens]
MSSKIFKTVTDHVSLPSPFSSIPRFPLLFPQPSPIQHLPRISAALGGKVQIYAKREDCNSGIAFGGNKTRKLEYLVADALNKGCDTLVSIGGVQSNHTRQVAGAAAAAGLKAKLLQGHWVDWPDPIYDKVGNIQLSRLMNADVHMDPNTFSIEHKDELKKLEEEVSASGGKPYYIPAGGTLSSDHPLGGLGFARWSLELLAQEEALSLYFPTILVCSVTGSTQAGMIVGFKIAESLLPESPPINPTKQTERQRKKKRKVIGIDASAHPSQTSSQILRIAQSTLSTLLPHSPSPSCPRIEIEPTDIHLDPRFHAHCYGIPDTATKAAIRFGAETEGFITDPVYEGKCLAGLMHMVRSGELVHHQTDDDDEEEEDGEEGVREGVLFVHLGGQAAVAGYASEL